MKKKMTAPPKVAASIQQGAKRHARGRFAQQADGRTKEAYDYQPAPGKWRCSICVGELRTKLLGKAKGRDHASAKELGAVSFQSADELRQHFHREHSRMAEPVGEQKTLNRIKRDKAQARP